ncbi:MAG: hypothetical protein Ta2E_09780 [Mycoplasmoidaceae bacterium]|nr:MAG: hypothetical protein Ta2E_09780 [Mycoplasmoidaceae bacterium]
MGTLYARIIDKSANPPKPIFQEIYIGYHYCLKAKADFLNEILIYPEYPTTAKLQFVQFGASIIPL